MSKKMKRPSYKVPDTTRYGRTQNYYSGGGLFGKINYFQKPDLIKPYLHYIDDRNLNFMVEKQIENDEMINRMLQHLNGQYGRNIPTTEFKKKILDIYRDKIKETNISNDIFKLYYNKMKDLSFEERTTKNTGKFKVLERSNDPISKIMTENSSLKSALFTRNIMSYLVGKMAYKLLEDPEEEKNMNKGSQAKREQALDDLIQQMMGPGGSDKLLDDMTNEAKADCQNFDQAVSHEQQDDLFDDAPEMHKMMGSGKGDILKTVRENLAKVNISMNALKEPIKKLMNKSVSYFSAQAKPFFENILDSDNVAGLEEYHNLHPRLRKFMIEDVMIKDVERVGKVDVYLDVSGSMESSSGAKDIKGNSISKLDFSKAFISKLFHLNMLENLYIFNDSVFQKDVNIFSIATIGADGGTYIDAVLTHMEKTKNNALIITDAEDAAEMYNERAYFIGTLGCNFSDFQHLETYRSKQQLVEFDGVKIRSIGEDGVAV